MLGNDGMNSPSWLVWAACLLCSMAPGLVVHGSTVIAAVVSVVLWEGGGVGNLGSSVFSLSVSSAMVISSFSAAGGLGSLFRLVVSRNIYLTVGRRRRQFSNYRQQKCKQ